MSSVEGAYWLTGDERCPHCLQRYSFAVERRCIHCDGPACPHCVTIVHATREATCVACAAEEAFDSDQKEP